MNCFLRCSPFQIGGFEVLLSVGGGAAAFAGFAAVDDNEDEKKQGQHRTNSHRNKLLIRLVV